MVAHRCSSVTNDRHLAEVAACLREFFDCSEGCIPGRPVKLELCAVQPYSLGFAIRRPVSAHSCKSIVAGWLAHFESLERSVFSRQSKALVAQFFREPRPVPLRRCCPPGKPHPFFNSLIPLRIVRSDIPVASATAEMPPRTSDFASVAAQRLRPRSSSP